MPDYNVTVNHILKVLDFIQFGGVDNSLERTFRSFLASDLLILDYLVNFQSREC